MLNLGASSLASMDVVYDMYDLAESSADPSNDQVPLSNRNTDDSGRLEFSLSSCPCGAYNSHRKMDPNPTVGRGWIKDQVPQ